MFCSIRRREKRGPIAFPRYYRSRPWVIRSVNRKSLQNSSLRPGGNLQSGSRPQCADGSLTLADSVSTSLATSQNKLSADGAWHRVEFDVGYGLHLYVDGALWASTAGSIIRPASVSPLEPANRRASLTPPRISISTMCWWMGTRSRIPACRATVTSCCRGPPWIPQIWMHGWAVQELPRTFTWARRTRRRPECRPGRRRIPARSGTRPTAAISITNPRCRATPMRGFPPMPPSTR